VARVGWSLIRVRAGVYALAGVFGVIAGLMLLGQTTSADSNIASRYTLVSIAAVILGGGKFVGGYVSPVGAVIGALTMTLAASFLTFLDIAPDWQVGMQGLILIVVLGLRAAIDRLERIA
jgi:ribose transport system permease protein